MSARRTKAEGVFAIIGEDSYLAEEALARLLDSRLGEYAAEAVEIIPGEESHWIQIVDAARSRSLFVTRRAVVVRRADELKGSAEALEEYLADPAPDTTLVLVAAKPDRRLGIWRKIADAATVVSAEPLKGRALRSYVSEQIRRRRIPIGDDGLQELLDSVGADLRRLMGELDKLEAFATGQSMRLGAEEVAAVLGRGFASPLYRVADAMCERRAARALELVEELLEEGESPLRILGAIHRALRQVWAAREMQGRRGSAKELITRMGVPAFKLDSLVEASRRWSEAELENAVRAVAEADRRLKSGALQRPVLTDAIVTACMGARQAS